MLHLLAAARQDAPWTLTAVHVNHNLHPDSGDWARHCRAVCRALDVELDVLSVDAACAAKGPKESPESRARALRYAAMAELLEERDVLVTAHHRDDQVETLLLRLLRGAGVLGLAAMRPVRPLGRGRLARPLLDCDRAELLAYACRQGLAWVEDASNADLRLDRNFIRHEVLPLLKKRWPSLVLPLSRTTAIHAETQSLLDDMARQDLASCAAGQASALTVSGLKELPPARRKNLLRYWVRSLGLPLPGERQLSQVAGVIDARRDSMALTGWPGAELRRCGDYVCLGAPLGPFDETAVHSWDFQEPCRLQHGELTAVPGRGGGLRRAACEQAAVQVRYRAGGETIRLPGRTGRRKVKKLFQEAGVPPWQRRRTPLIYLDDRLALVAGLWIDADCLAGADEDSWVVSWSAASDVGGMIYFSPQS